MTDAQAVILHCTDGVELEGEWHSPEGVARGTVVLCHPHPQYGGTMRSIVVSALFGALPAAGYGCLRFNFRGVEGSGGEHGAGEAEPTDVRAAIDTATGFRIAGVLAVVGWSFGGDMALSIDVSRVDGWVGIAPPLQFGSRFGAVAAPAEAPVLNSTTSSAPADVQEEVATWTNTTTSGARRATFVGRTDRVSARRSASSANWPANHRTVVTEPAR